MKRITSALLIISLILITMVSSAYAKNDAGTAAVDSISRLKNITYSNKGDRVYFLIKKAALTRGTKNLKPLYTDSLDETGRVYTVTFPARNADIGEGVLDINDEYVKSLEVRKNGDGTTSIIFTGQSENSYLIYKGFRRHRGNGHKACSRRQGPVVIDAGHGGTAKGGYYGDLYEKDSEPGGSPGALSRF